MRCLLVLSAAVALASCPGSVNRPIDPPPDDAHRVAAACDPAGLAECFGSVFECETSGDDVACVMDGAPGPDDGAWACEEVGHMIRCSGDHVPEASGWVCAEAGDGLVWCQRHSDYPETEPAESWWCEIHGAERTCELRDEPVDEGAAEPVEPPDWCAPGADYDEVCCDGFDNDCDGDLDLDDEDCVPTDEVCCDGLDNDCNGIEDEGCTCDPAMCVCAPAAWRFCDTRDFGHWGTQVCREDGMEWGPCVEVEDVPEACAAVAPVYAPAVEACCIEQGQCCQDTWDLDLDGDLRESLPQGCPAAECIDV